MDRRIMLNASLGLATSLALWPGPARAQMRNIKATIVGEQMVGKSAITIRFITDIFLDSYDPTIADNYRKQFPVNGAPILFEVWDTVGEESEDATRQAGYGKTNIFLVIFDISRRTTLDKVQTRWVPELKRLGGGAPWMLVGNKTDLRGGASASVATSEARALAQRNGAAAYRECSALSNTGIPDLFVAASGATRA